MARRDVRLLLTANYLHIFLTKIYRKFEFSVSCYFTCSVLVQSSSLFGDHRLQRAGRGSRSFRAPHQTSHCRVTEQQTRGLNQDCYMSAKSANVQENAICPKISKKKISPCAHLDKLLLLWIVLLDHLILNCTELLTSFKSYKEV